MRDTDDTITGDSAALTPLAWVFGGVLAAALAVAFALGATLGTFLGGLALVILLVPWAAVSQTSISRQWFAMACVTDAVALTWLVLVLRERELHILQWLMAYCLLLAVAMMLWGLTLLLRQARLGAWAAAALVTFVALAWLSAPAWLLHHLQTPSLLPTMHRVIAVHPLFAMNSIWPLGVWTESPLAYRVLNLNQDVFYELPRTPWPAVVAHLVIAVPGLICIKAMRRGNRTN